MPTYVYQNCDCPEAAELGESFEANVPIAVRDNVRCKFCGEINPRKIAFTGLTWAPSAGGMR